MIYTFITEDGSLVLDYREYLKDKALMERINDPDRLLLNLGLTIISFDKEYLSEHSDKRDMVSSLKRMQDENPLQFFMPSAIRQSGAIDFLNDTSSEIKLLTANNRGGKTATGIVDQLLDAVPTSEKWPIFSKHGITWRKFHKPLMCGFATSDWTVAQRVLWPEIRKWIPRYELGEYDPRVSGHRDIAWRVNPSIQLKCGSILYFFCYEQDQGAYEGMALDRFYWDEQGHKAKFDGADERLRTRKGRHTFGLTPHKVEGRPDTGARSFIHKFVMDAADTGRSAGHSVAHYKITVEDIPDWVYPESEKKKAYEKWVTIPKRNNDVKMIKEGRSRYYGDFHDVGGLVFDEWDDRYHLIDPFTIPDTWTRYRIIDHGSVNPTACLLAAVSPEGNVYLYDEYYKPGLQISENVKGIISMCMNELEPRGLHSAGKGLYYERYSEKCVKQRFHKTIMDSRSRQMKDPAFHLDIGTLYEWSGLRTISAAGVDSDTSIPVVKQMLSIDMNKTHPHNGAKGSPQIFVFRNLENFIREIRSYAWQEFKSSQAASTANLKEKPVKKDDHLMSCLIYLCMSGPRYIEGTWAYNRPPQEREEDDDEDNQPRNRFKRRDPYTGY